MKLTNGSRKRTESATMGPTLWLTLGCFCLLAVGVSASPPAWWSDRGAVLPPQITTNSGVVTTNYLSNDYAVVTQGQLKFFSSKAVTELNSNLTNYGGAGTNLNAMMSNWAIDYATNGYNATNLKPSDYTVMDVGQLKYIGNKVWSQLVAAGYTHAAPAWMATNLTDNQVANLGQLKQVFNFDLTADTDNNGLPDWWETKYFGGTGTITGFTASSSPDGNGLTLLQDYQQGNDPTNYYSQHGGILTPNLAITGGNNEANLAGLFAPLALTVTVTDGTGNALLNAPVNFAVNSGGGLVATSILGSTSSSVTAYTDVLGQAQVYFLQPTTAGVTSAIAATTGGQSVNFTELSTSPASAPTLTPVPGAYASQQKVTVSSTTPNATIYYTTDGSTPTVNSASVASGGTIPVAQNQVLNLMAVASGFDPSPVTAALYRIGSNDLAAADSFTMLRKADGNVRIWGDNSRGQLGDDYAEPQNGAPQQIAGLAGITQISAAGDHALAVDVDGNVWAWGANDASQGGQGGYLNLPVPTEAPTLSAIVSVFAGPSQGFALDVTGQLHAWGANNYGQLGDGNPSGSYTDPEVVSTSSLPADVHFVKIASGPDHTLALASDGTVWATGSNAHGQLGDGTTTDSSIFEKVPGINNVIDISAGIAHSLALKTDGTVWAWGADEHGQLGDGNSDSGVAIPQQIVLPGAAIAIAAVDTKSYAVLADGTVRCFGQNSEGEMGIGNNVQDQPTPVQPLGIGNVALLAAGIHHAVICTTSGSLFGWGDNTSYKLTQDFAANNFTSGTEVHDPAWQGFINVASAEGTTVALKNDGTVWTSGEGDNGALGQGDWYPTERPVQVSGIRVITQIAAGQQSAFAITSTGTLWAWGRNSDGQLGLGNTDPQCNPQQVTALAGVTAVAAGYNHMLAIQSDGTVWATGDNSQGELGDGTTTSQSVPIEISGLTDPVQLAAGDHTSFALQSDGTVWAWGKNDTGQLGLGTTGNVSTPTQITFPGGAHMVAIAVRRNNAVGIDTAGKVWNWGILGQANGAPYQQPQPTSLKMIAVAPGNFYDVALQSDGTVWGVGTGSSGQLGNNGYSFVFPFAQFSGVKGVSAIASDAASTLLLKQDGSISGFGDCRTGQLAAGLGIYVLTPKPLIGIAQSETPPTVSVSINSDAHVVSLPTPLRALASASPGSITGVDFYENGVQIGSSVASGPWSISYTPNTYGDISLTAVAHDSAGVAQISAPVTLPVLFDWGSNGLADWWEELTLRSVYNNAASLAPSGDGNTLLQEYHLQIGQSTGNTGYTMEPPSIIPIQNQSDASVAVSLSARGSATVRYTLDGSTPTASSSAYTGPITLTAATTIETAAFVGGSEVTGVASQRVGLAVTAPTSVSATPGNYSVNLSWTNTATNASSIAIQANIGGTWETVLTVSGTSTSAVVSNVSADQAVSYQVVAEGQFGASLPTASSAVTPLSVPPRYAVIDLGAGMTPQKILNSGYVLMTDSAGVYHRWNGTTTGTLTVPSRSSVSDMSGDGTVVGKGVDSTGATVLLTWPPDTATATATVTLTATETHYYSATISSPAIDDNHNIWLTRYQLNLPISGEYTEPDLSGHGFYTASVSDFMFFDDGFYNGTEVGAIAASSDPIYENYEAYELHGLGDASLFGWLTGYEILPQLLTETGTAVCSKIAYTVFSFQADNWIGPTAPVTNTFTESYQELPVYFLSINGASSGTTLPFQPTALNNASSIVGQPVVSGTFSYWDSSSGTVALPSGFHPANINAAVDASNHPAYQILGTDSTGHAALLEMDPATGQFPAQPTLISDYLYDSSWGAFSLGSGGGKLNDSGAIVGTATYTPTGGGDPIAAGAHGVLLCPIEQDLVNHDDLTKVWSDMQVQPGLGTVYAGTTTGDMVEWKVKGASGWLGGTFTWTATDSNSNVITGPTGVGVDHWQISNGGNDPATKTTLTWKPDTYKIKCVISFSGGGTIPIQFTQKVGWRTEDYLVIGQIITTHTYDSSGPSTLESPAFRTAICTDYPTPVPPGIGTAIAAAPVPNSVLGLLEFALWGLQPHASTSQGPLSYLGAITEAHRYWMLQNGLNASVDSPTVPATAPDQIAASALPGILSAQQYRILHHYQTRFTLTPDGKIDQTSLKSLYNVTDIGPTKINLLDFPAHYFSSWGWDNAAFGPQPASEKNTNNGKEQTSADGTKHSSYASGRVGSDAQNVNWHVYGQDVPWIYSEIICQVASDHTVTSNIKMSVNKTWQDSSGVSGTVNFNNLNIYKAVFTPADGSLNYVPQHDSPLLMEGQVKPFIESVPSGTWPSPPTTPSVQ